MHIFGIGETTTLYIFLQQFAVVLVLPLYRPSARSDMEMLVQKASQN